MGFRTAGECYLTARAISARAVDVVSFVFIWVVLAALTPLLFGEGGVVLKQGMVWVALIFIVLAAFFFLRGFAMELAALAAVPKSTKVTVPFIGGALTFSVAVTREAVLGAAKAFGMVAVMQLALLIYIYLVPVHLVASLLPVLIAAALIAVLTGRILGLSPKPALKAMMVIASVIVVVISLLALMGGPGVIQQTEAAFDNALPAPEATEHTLGVCKDAEELTVPRETSVFVRAYEDCWSGIVRATEGSYLVYPPQTPSGGWDGCVELFFLNPAGEVSIAGDRGDLVCGSDDEIRPGIFRIRYANGPSAVRVEVK